MRILLLLSMAGCATAGAPSGALVAAHTADPDERARIEAARCEALVPRDFRTIQAAIDAGVADVCVDEGVFEENLRLERPARIIGRGRGITVLDGRRAGTVVTARGAAIALVGLSLRGGSAFDGGGLRVEQGSATLEYVGVTGNQADGYGAGIYARESDLVLDHVRVRKNRAGGSGAGIYADTVTLTASDVVLADNTGRGWGGGGLYQSGGTLDIAGSEILRNRLRRSEDGGGAGLFAENVSGSVRGTVIAGNAGLGRGGGMYLANSELDVENVTIAGNQATVGGAAFLLDSGVAVAFRDSVLAANVAMDEAGGVSLQDGARVSFTRCAAWQNTGEEEGVDPRFRSFSLLDPVHWDFHLADDSPWIDAGDPDMTDRDGTIADVGAFGGPDAPGER